MFLFRSTPRPLAGPAQGTPSTIQPQYANGQGSAQANTNTGAIASKLLCHATDISTPQRVDRLTPLSDDEGDEIQHGYLALSFARTAQARLTPSSEDDAPPPDRTGSFDEVQALAVTPSTMDTSSQVLAVILDNDDCTTSCCNAPHHYWTPLRCENLERLLRAADLLEDEGGVLGDGAASGLKMKGKGGRKKRKRDGEHPTVTHQSMQRLFNRKTITPLESVVELLRVFNPDAPNFSPALFFTDEYMLDHNVASQEDMDLAQRFDSCCLFKKDLRNREMMDRFRGLLTDLLMFDIVKIINPRAKGGRVGEVMKTDITSMLSKIYSDDPDKALAMFINVNEWCQAGKKLDGFWRRLGPASLVYLIEDFSKDFITNKMRHEGNDQFEDVVNHLHGLGIQDRDDAVKYKALMLALREYQLAPFRAHLER